MNLKSIAHARIHPAIGVARIGNSDEYFIGPEVPHPTPPPSGGYRDATGKLKRQAALFRIYGYDAQGQVVGELTSADSTSQTRKARGTISTPPSIFRKRTT
jgi:hypothetical protein